MQNKIYIQIVVGISLLILTSPTGAQDEQWLQYHSEREAQRIIGDMASSHLEVTSEKPQVVELPDFKCDDPFFARWSTPMVASGGLWIAFDRQNKLSHPYDLLYIDSNGDGNLADESAIASYEVDYHSSRRTTFGPIKLIFKGEDGPITYHINIEFLNYIGRKYLYIRAAGWYEGDITVAGVKKHCVLIDHNANGTFNDKSLNAAECDRIRIGEKDIWDSLFVGNYIEIDDVLYRPEIARDGAYIKLSKAEDVIFGNIRLPETITEFSAGGENGLFTLKPDKGTGSLPVGRYRVNYWAIERKDEKGKKWKMQGEGFSGKGDFDITEVKEAELSIGEPIISTIEPQNRSGTRAFSHNLKGLLDERIELTSDGARPQAPRLNIKSKDGMYDRTFSFEYG
ncbi:MAG TPA: hypothetical protein VMW72_18910 [Sedimentisphaerales bacterium]|nr:hypothetical protein [Sedimentisphaerales bacterium]